MGPNPYGWVLEEKGEEDWRPGNRRNTGRANVEVDAEMEVRCLQANERQGCWQPQKRGRKYRVDSPQFHPEPSPCPGLWCLASLTHSSKPCLHQTTGRVLNNTETKFKDQLNKTAEYVCVAGWGVGEEGRLKHVTF